MRLLLIRESLAESMSVSVGITGSLHNLGGSVTQMGKDQAGKLVQNYHVVL